MTFNWALIIILHISTAGGIVNGQSIPIEKAPWQISLQLQNHHFCGGSILTSSAILTAAHCVSSFQANEFHIRAGSKYWNKGGQFVQVERITEHPRFNRTNYLNDVAILHLSTPLRFNRNTNSIPLARKTPAKGDRVYVSGWGFLKQGSGVYSDNLKNVKMKMISTHACRKSGYAKKRKQIRKGMICALGNKRDACQGDSGGPLVSNGKLVGIVSWGIGCARKEYPGVYTDVAYYRNWILLK